MTIIIRLPRPFLGRVVLDAFRNAATFSVDGSTKWQAHSYSTARGTAHEGDTYIPDQGMIATPVYFREQGRIARFLRGRKPGKWETREGMTETFMTQVKLHALSPQATVTEVKTSVHHERPADDLGFGVLVTSTPDDPAFAPFRAAYDRIVRGFLERLV